MWILGTGSSARTSALKYCVISPAPTMRIFKCGLESVQDKNGFLGYEHLRTTDFTKLHGDKTKTIVGVENHKMKATARIQD